MYGGENIYVQITNEFIIEDQMKMKVSYNYKITKRQQMDLIISLVNQLIFDKISIRN